MSRLLVHDCEVVVTMDDAGTELPEASILVEDGVISWVGTGPPPAEPDERLDGSGQVALPGLVNCHHHLYQSLTRVRAQGEGLFGWLVELYPVWARLDEEWERAASRVALAQLALSGCSTTTDHHYVFPPAAGDPLGVEVEAARELGIRFHPCRGSMDLGESDGGLPPDAVCEPTEDALARSEEAVKRFHDPAPGSMVRIALAPCSPFSVTERLMRETADLARRHGVRLHTHLAETLDEERFCLERFGRRPTELMETWGWLGEDVWFAHCVHLSDPDVRRLGETRTGVSWCPSSNLRLGAGIAPGRALIEAGARVGLGTDGSASNEGARLSDEVHQALLVSRAEGPEPGLSAREALWMATRGGASVLGRDDVGSLEAGKRADVALFAVDGMGFAGAGTDPVAALAFGGPDRVRQLLVEGQPVVADGHLVAAEEEEIAREGHRVARRIAEAGG
ncbi:MAG TPA: 8-oxoguanine deaminase [Actinomycetota bacterium]|nr:8-oxoguanine deaminase [Actinomycetota bacterium]